MSHRLCRMWQAYGIHVCNRKHNFDPSTFDRLIIVVNSVQWHQESRSECVEIFRSKNESIASRISSLSLPSVTNFSQFFIDINSQCKLNIQL